MTQKFHLVAHEADLERLLKEVARHEAIALDTEADSLHHYHEKLCLIQLATGESQWIIDPLAPLELGELLRQLENRELILHGADYDLRLLFRAYHFKPERIFDTMLAAQLLGRQRIGLAALVEEFFGVVLPKKGQKADWSRRPLPPDLLEYAADDTRYLARTAERLRAELETKGRISWHTEVCRRQIAVCRVQRHIDRSEAWRIKGGKHLCGRAGAVLKELWTWREEAAARADRPPFKIVSNEFLIQWAVWVADRPAATYDDAPERPPWLTGSRLKSFNASLARALELPPAEWPGPLPPQEGRRRVREEESTLVRLLAARDAVARSLELDPGVLGPREVLREILRRRPLNAEAMAHVPGLMEWQRAALAPVILPLLGAAASMAEQSEETLNEAAEASGLE